MKHAGHNNLKFFRLTWGDKVKLKCRWIIYKVLWRTKKILLIRSLNQSNYGKISHRKNRGRA